MFKEPLRPFLHTSLYTFSWTTPLPSDRTYFMNDPKVIHNKETSVINTFFFTNLYMKVFFEGFLKKLPRCVFRNQSNM